MIFIYEKAVDKYDLIFRRPIHYVLCGICEILSIAIFVYVITIPIAYLFFGLSTIASIYWAVIVIILVLLGYVGNGVFPRTLSVGSDWVRIGTGGRGDVCLAFLQIRVMKIIHMKEGRTFIRCYGLRDIRWPSLELIIRSDQRDTLFFICDRLVRAGVRVRIRGENGNIGAGNQTG